MYRNSQEPSNQQKSGAQQVHKFEPGKKANSWLSRCSLLWPVYSCIMCVYKWTKQKLQQHQQRQQQQQLLQSIQHQNNTKTNERNTINQLCKLHGDPFNQKSQRGELNYTHTELANACMLQRIELLCECVSIRFLLANSRLTWMPTENEYFTGQRNSVFEKT